jgi:WD40 repeat protein/tetratricopeptide (TPR) repeat protein
MSENYYVVGGPLGPKAASYVYRQADEVVYQALMRGEACSVLTPSQTGKTSLMARAAARLAADGVTVARVNLEVIGADAVPERWYYTVLNQVGEDLGLWPELRASWERNAAFDLPTRWMKAIGEGVLAGRPGPVVIFIDEIGVVAKLPFAVDDFFAAIRASHNQTVRDPDSSRLTFCLLGVATPTELLRDPHTPAFNVGRRIVLNDFMVDEAAPLARGLDRDESLSARLLGRILHWTGGHPYLTQRLCKAVAEDPDIRDPNGVDRTCARLFFAPGARNQEVNLRAVERQILGRGDRAGILELYRRVRSKRVLVRDDERGPNADVLRISGITRAAGGRLVVRNRIYERVFDGHWIRANMPDAERRRQRRAFRRGLSFAMAASLLVLGIISGLSWQALTQTRMANESAQRAKESAQKEINALLRASEADRKATEALKTQLKANEQRRVFAALALDRSLDLSKKGETGEGFLWIIRSLQIAPEDATDFRHAAWAELRAWRHRVSPLRAILPHPGSVLAVAFSPDGTRMLTGSEDHTARLWARESDTGWRLDKTLKHENRVRAVAFSPDGKRVLTGSEDKTAQIWEVATGQPMGEPLKHEGEVWAVAFSPDGTQALTGCQDKAARLWEVATGQPLGEPLRHPGPVWAVAFSPNGRRVLTGSGDTISKSGEARLWETATGQQLGPPLKDLLQGLIWAVAFSPDGTRILTGSQERGSNRGAARLWDATSGRLLGTPLPHQDRVRAVAFSPDGTQMLTGSGEWSANRGEARLWSVATGQPLSAPLVHPGAVWAVAFSPAGRRVLTGSGESGSNRGEARLWETATGRQLIETLIHRGPVRAVAFSPDGTRILTGSREWGGNRGEARLWRREASTGWRLDKILEHPGRVRAVAFSPDGTRVLTGGEDKTARLWDADTGRLLGVPLTHQEEVWLAAFSRDGTRILTGNVVRGAKRAEVWLWQWNAATGQTKGLPLRHDNPVWAASFSPDGTRVLTASTDGMARLWDAANGRLSLEIMTGQDPITSVAFSPDGKWVLTANQINQIGVATLWDAADGHPLVERLSHQGPIWAVAFSPDGTRVLTASEDRTVRLWDALTGRPTGMPLQHDGPVFAATFSPDGTRMLTASEDQTVRLWDAATGWPLGQPLQHAARVTTMAFSPDGTRVLTASMDEAARLWEATVLESDPKRLDRDLKQFDLWTQVITGQKLDDSNAVHLLDDVAWGETREELARRGVPRIDAIPSERILDWHRCEAQESELTEQWFAARWHLDRLINARPTDGSLYARRGHILVKLEEWSQAIDDCSKAIGLKSNEPEVFDDRGSAHLGLGQGELAFRDYSEAIERAPTRWAPLASRGRAHAKLGQWNEAIDDYTRAIELGKDRWETWDGRGHVYAALDQWDKASHDFEKACELAPDAYQPRCHLAHARLAMSYFEAYRHECEQLLDRFGFSEDRTICHTIAQVCTLSPRAVADPIRPVELARKAVERASAERVSGVTADLLSVLGATLHRARQYADALRELDDADKEGQYEDALRELDDADKDDNLLHRESNDLFLAMTHHRLGNADLAEQWLNRAQERGDAIGQVPPGDATPESWIAWDVRMQNRLLLREAEALIRPTER